MTIQSTFSKLTIGLCGGVLSLLLSTPQAYADYPCPLNFYYEAGEGCVPTYNTYSNVVWGTTVVPGASYYNTSTYNADAVHSYYPAAGYNGVGHYNFGGPNYYHRNFGGGAYFHR